MKKSQLLVWSVVNSIGVLLYTSAVAWVLFNAGKVFGKVTDFWGPLAFLLLFVLSATIVGLLVLGRPIYLYLNGSKSEAFRLLFLTVGWLLLFTVVLLFSLVGAA
ncbi:MAG: hypothetical protein V1696_00675 [Candidatus Jorgensenbacteria bacterium]